MSLQPGLCNVFYMLSQKVRSMPADERCCALLLDKVSLNRALTIDRFRGMESVESYVGYFEINAVFNGKPVKSLENM